MKIYCRDLVVPPHTCEGNPRARSLDKFYSAPHRIVALGTGASQVSWNSGDHKNSVEGTHHGPSPGNASQATPRAGRVEPSAPTRSDQTTENQDDDAETAAVPEVRMGTGHRL